MSAEPYLCPCERVVYITVRDNAGRYWAEFRDADHHETAACRCGENLYEMLAAGQLRALGDTTHKGATP